MLEAAGRTLAPFNFPSRVERKGARKDRGQRRAARELGRVEKRLGYFLIWARSHGAEVAPSMAADVRTTVLESAEHAVEYGGNAHVAEVKASQLHQKNFRSGSASP